MVMEIQLEPVKASEKADSPTNASMGLASFVENSAKMENKLLGNDSGKLSRL